MAAAIGTTKLQWQTLALLFSALNLQRSHHLHQATRLLFVPNCRNTDYPTKQAKEVCPVSKSPASENINNSSASRCDKLLHHHSIQRSSNWILFREIEFCIFHQMFVHVAASRPQVYCVSPPYLKKKSKRWISTIGHACCCAALPGEIFRGRNDAFYVFHIKQNKKRKRCCSPKNQKECGEWPADVQTSKKEL